VVHDYCYSSPWRGDPNGRSKCVIRFKELMDDICRGNLPCLATSRIYYLAVRSAAGNLYELIQDEVEKGRVTCTIHKSNYSEASNYSGALNHNDASDYSEVLNYSGLSDYSEVTNYSDVPYRTY